jgi:hypothetical protein
MFGTIVALDCPGNSPAAVARPARNDQRSASRARVGAIALPSISRHVDPTELRRTLLEERGHAQNLWPFEDILTIDLLHVGPQRLREDIEHFRDSYASMHPDFRGRFESFVSLIGKA